MAVYDFNDPFFGALIKQIQAQAHEHNYSLILAGFLNRSPDVKDLQALHKYALDGLIVIGTDLNAAWLKGFTNLPVARIGHGGTDEQSFRVATDETAAAELLIRHLLNKGCKRPVYLHAYLPAHRIRKEYFEEAARRTGAILATAPSLKRDPFAAGMQSARQLLAAGRRVDAFICATDQVAMGALHALHDAGVHVPEEVAVTGFDDIPAAVQFIPLITTIRQPIGKMVRLAFKAVIDADSATPGPTLLPGKLVARQSA